LFVLIGGMPPPDTLLTYPYVIVRIGCDACSRSGRYRLARLAEKYGADIELDALLAYLAGDCKHWGHSHPYRFRCQARFRDLEPPRRPPDLPAMRLRVVKGGKS
jgi:hypothetical protein